MRDLKDLQDFWRAHRAGPLVMAIIVRKTGSGYRAAGARKIITRGGPSCGFLSGGCLEGEILGAARQGWHDMPFIRSFSTLSEEDRLMGYQTGCAGVLDILFYRLPDDIALMTDHIPFGEPGAGTPAAWEIDLTPANLGQRRGLDRLPSGQRADTFIDPWIRPINLYVVGCGPNAGPFAALAPALGWNVMFLDYRQDYTIANGPDVVSRIVPLAELGAMIPEGSNNAVVVMTHNYEADMTVIAQLNGKSYGYLGCVGPRRRFQQIGADLKKFHNIILDEGWAARVHVPAGLKQGRTPEAIAFSIIAEIQFGMAGEA